MERRDPLELITAGRQLLAAEDRGGWSAGALSDRMLAMAAERERFEAEFVRLTAEWNAIGAWGVDGFVSASAWLADPAPLTNPAAGRVLRSARHVRRFGATGDALASGAVTCEKVEALAEAARHREELYKRDEHMLLDIAARLSVRDLLIVLRTWRQLADDEIADDEAKHAFARVHFDICPGVLGSDLAGFLDPHGSAMLAKALDLIEPPDPNDASADTEGGADAPRTLSQRRGEGLVKLAQFFLDRRRPSEGSRTGSGTGSGESTTSASGRSTATVDALFTPQRHHLPFEHQRSEIVGFGPVPASTIARLACEARAGWAVLDERREVLDLGRRARTVSAAQRRAVVLRDEHCVHPGCRAPAGGRGRGGGPAHRGRCAPRRRGPRRGTGRRTGWRRSGSGCRRRRPDRAARRTGRRRCHTRRCGGRWPGRSRRRSRWSRCARRRRTPAGTAPGRRSSPAPRTDRPRRYCPDRRSARRRPRR